MRKIVAIAAQAAHVVSLCGDGTVWRYDIKAKALKWEQLPEIPQDQSKKVIRKFADEEEPYLVCRPGIMGKSYLDNRSNAWTENPDRATKFVQAAAIQKAETIPGLGTISFSDAMAAWNKLIEGPKPKKKK